MAYWIDESANFTNSRQIHFFMDSDSDVTDLPTSSSSGTPQTGDTVSCRPCGKGSRAFSIQSGTTYYLDSTGEWVAPGEDNG